MLANKRTKHPMETLVMHGEEGFLEDIRNRPVRQRLRLSSPREGVHYCDGVAAGVNHVVNRGREAGRVGVAEALIAAAAKLRDDPRRRLPSLVARLITRRRVV